MADTDRRTVKPAHPDATIPDPDRRDRLPAEGREVPWSHYWQHHLDKENVVLVPATDWAEAWAAQLPPPAPAAPAPAAAPEAPPAVDAAH